MFFLKKRDHVTKYLISALLVALTFSVLVCALPVSVSTASAAATTWDPSLGWDFECHTNTHPSLISMSKAAIIAELQAVNTAFQAHGYPPPQHMAYPYGDYNSNVESIVSPYRKSARTVSDDMTAYPVTNWYEMNAAQLIPTTTKTDITNWINLCISTKSLLLIFTHDISTNPSEYGCTPAMLTYLLDTLVTQQNAGKIVVMTMAQAYDYWNNAPTQPKPTVVVSFDDANESDYSVAYRLFKARGLKGTSYIVTSVIDEDVQLSWAEIATMRATTANFALHLESKQNTNTTSNKGTITFNGTSYALPTNVLKTRGNYKAQYYPASGYTFDHWETTGSLTLTGTTINPTTVTVNGNGTLRAIYKTSAAYSFTDGFESGSFSGWTGTMLSAGEAVTIATTPVHAGTKSAKYTSNAGGNAEYSFVYKTVNLNEAYVKGSFYITSGLPLLYNGDRFYLIGLQGTSNQVYAGVWRTAGIDRWVIHAKNGTNWMNFVTNTSAPLPSTNRWVTIELHWKESSTTGLVELYVNGVKIITVTGINTASYGNTTRIDFGLAYAYLRKNITIYGDDATISNTYVAP